VSKIRRETIGALQNAVTFPIEANSAETLIPALPVYVEMERE
jgi:hypothetical protein